MNLVLLRLESSNFLSKIVGWSTACRARQKSQPLEISSNGLDCGFLQTRLPGEDWPLVERFGDVGEDYGDRTDGVSVGHA